jgi:hypothetical protein
MRCLIKIHPVVLTVIIAWLLIPTGTPDDIITWAIIAKLGTQAYIFVLMLVGLLLYHYHVNFSKAKKIYSSFLGGK